MFLLGDNKIRLIKEERKEDHKKRTSDVKSPWIRRAGTVGIFLCIAVLAFIVMYRVLPEDNKLLPAPVLSMMGPFEIMQGTQAPEDVRITIQGDNLDNIADIVLNGYYESGCDFDVTDQYAKQGDEENGDQSKNSFGQIMSVTIPSTYYEDEGEINIQVETLDPNTGRRSISNPVTVKVLSTEDIEAPVITEVNRQTLNLADTGEQWIMVKGEGFDQDTYITVNGEEKDSIYDEKSKTHTFKLDYSDWCLFDNIYINVGKRFSGYNTPVKSERYTIKVEGKDQSYDWDNSWTGNHYVACGLGSINDMYCTNSLEAFDKNYKSGQRLFEADLCFSADGELILKNGWRAENYGSLDENYESYERNNLAKDWKDISGASALTMLSFDDLLNLMEKHPDMYVITDMEDDNSEAVELTLRNIVSLAKKHDAKVLDRLVIQVYNEPMFYQVMNIYPFKSVIYNMTHAEATDSDVLELVKATGIGAICCDEERLSDALTAQLYQVGCPVYLQVIDKGKDVKRYARRGVHGFYSNDLGSYNCNVDIAKLRNELFSGDIENLISQGNKGFTEENYQAFKQYLKDLNSDNYIIVLTVNDDASKGMTKELHNILAKFGIKKKALKDDGYSFIAVIDDKNCVSQKYAPEVLTEDLWTSGVRIRARSVGSVERAGPISVVTIDGTTITSTEQGLNMVVYDKNLGKVVDSVCFNLHDSYQKTEIKSDDEKDD